jgi:phage terminase small subunit
MPQKVKPTIAEPPIKPPDLSAAASPKWDEIIALLPKNYLAPIDGFELKILVVLLTQSDGLAAKLEADPDAESTHRLYLNVCKQIHQLSAAFGLNPHDRSRLGLVEEPTDDPEDPITQFLAQIGSTREAHGFKMSEAVNHGN